MYLHLCFCAKVPVQTCLLRAVESRDGRKDMDSRCILPLRERGIQAAMEQVSSGDFYIEYIDCNRVIENLRRAGGEHRNTGTQDSVGAVLLVVLTPVAVHSRFCNIPYPAVILCTIECVDGVHWRRSVRWTGHTTREFKVRGVRKLISPPLACHQHGDWRARLLTIWVRLAMTCFPLERM